MKLLGWLTAVVLAGCGGDRTPDAGAPEDAGLFVPTSTHALGLNDVTWLLPLESLDAGSPFPSAAQLLPLGPFSRLTMASPLVQVDLSRVRLVGLRFDLCDRATTAPCADDADASLRLVLQPLFQGPPAAFDIALHAFFPIPRAEVPRVVDELRALAARQDVARGAALRINTAFASDPEYRARLAAFVARYASSPRLHRLTLFGQETEHAALVWIFRGEELQHGAMAPITIADVHDTAQEVRQFGGDSYTVTPLADAPAGFSRALMDTDFRASTPAQQLEAVSALLAVDNPLLHTSQTTQCVTCHLATTLLPPRASDAGIDVASQPERYSSTDFDLTPLGARDVRARTLRALGWLGSSPIVSQRVVNESANVVQELERRFPPPR